MKKILALILALMLVLGMSSAFAAAADTNVAVTVNNVTTGNTLKLYKVAGVSVGSNNTLTYTTTSGLPEAYDTISEIEAITNANQVTAMAQAFGAYFAGKEADYSAVAASNAATIEGGVAPGYYYAIIEGTKDSGEVYQPMLINAVPVADSEGSGSYVAHDAIETYAKKEPVTITKTEDKTADDETQVKTTDGYSVGDDIDFTITTKMPNYPANATKAKAVITDTPTGLTDKTNTVKVYINGSDTETEAGENTFAVEAKDKGFTVTFAEKFILDHPGESIVVTYTATLENAGNVTATTKNRATITYNTNPYVDSEVEPGDETDQNNYGVYVFKYKDGSGPKEALAGAKFVLKNAVADTSEGAAEGATKAGETIIGEEKTTGADGYVYWEGLKNGIYYLVETAAPAGYRLDSTPIPVVLDKANATLDNPATADKTEQYYNKAEVPNTEGTSLPSTGGIGTTIFYVAGSILVLAAAILLITKRRMSAND